MHVRLVVPLLVLLACPKQQGAPTAPAAYGEPELLWQRGGCGSWCQTGWYSSPAVVDLDGDGEPEVVWAAADVVALRAADGAVVWRGAGDARVWAGPVVADLDGDGSPEVAVGRGGGTLAVYGADGGVRWSKTLFGGAELRTLAAADLDGDGKLELVTGAANGGATGGQVTVLDAAGNVVPGWPAIHAGEPGYAAGLYDQNVAIADLDGDGDAEIVAPSDVHYVMAFRRDGTQLPANARYGQHGDGTPRLWSEVGVHVSDEVDRRGYANCGTDHRPNFAESPPVIADLDGDGTKEIVIVGNVNDCSGDYTSLYHMPFVLNRDRSRWKAGPFDWTAIPPRGAGTAPLSEDYGVIELALPSPVVADLDGDGKKEILFPSYDGKLHAYGLDKREPGSWPYSVGGPGIRFASEPAVADLDGDGTAEVIFATWPQKAGGGTGHLVILDHLGRLTWRVALPEVASGWNGGLGAPAVAHVPGDPDVRVFVGTASSGVVAYRIPGTAAAVARWGTGRGNTRRDGAVP
jgi:hypothetical protein